MYVTPPSPESTSADPKPNTSTSRDSTPPNSTLPSEIRFGVFEVDPRARELRKKGSRVKLQQQPFELLMILLGRPGQTVTREELRQKMWPADVYVDFDRGLNKAMVKLRDALGDSSDSPLYIETLPRVGYRFIGPVVVSAAPRAAAVAETGTGTEIGAASERGGEADAADVAIATLARTNWRAVAAASLLVLVAAGGIFWYREHNASAAPAQIRSVAVLPLENLSGDANQNYFADGVTDELTTMIAKNSNLRVTSRTSATQFKGAHESLRDIARRLDVDGIIEGSITRNGDNVHMNIQLIRAADDAHVWAESYDRTAGEMASLPSEAATTIAKKLNSVPVRSSSARQVNPAAYDAYLHGQYLMAEGRGDDGIAEFRKAAELQPDYALPWVALAIYYGDAMDQDRLSPANGGRLMVEAAKKAVEIDDELPEAHRIRGLAYYSVEWDFARADAEFAKAVELNPRYAEAMHFRTYSLVVLNRYDEAIAMQKQATEIDPFRKVHSMAQVYAFTRRFDEAAADAKLRLESSPNDAESHYTLSYIYQCQGKYNESIDELATAWTMWNMNAEAAGLRSAFARGGYNAALEYRIALLEKTAKTGYFPQSEIAALTAQLGERERTLTLLEDAVAKRDMHLPLIQTDPAYDFLHADPRYRAVVKAIGLPPAY